MSVYRTVVEYIQQLGVKPGQSIRTQCPICGRRGGFTVSNKNGYILWNCYFDSCKTKGIKKKNVLTVEDVNSIILETEKPDWHNNLILPRNWRKNFLPLEASYEALKLVKEFRCMNAYLDGRLHMGYDPYRDRVVFYIMFGHYVVDALSKSLNSSKGQPKWWRYGSSGLPLIVESRYIQWKNEVIIVEDAFSSGVCSELRDTLVLGGTNITDTYLEILIERWNVAYIILDPEAIGTAADMKAKLEPYMDHVFVHFVANDPKYLTAETLGRKGIIVYNAFKKSDFDGKQNNQSSIKS